MTLRCILAPLASPDTLRGQVTDADWAAAAAFPPCRRAEYLTWRAVVYRELGAVPIGYDAAGAPVLTGSDCCISVAHCADRIAVCISPKRCAVDIEPASRDFSRAESRYTTPSERALSDDPLWPGIVWCAKEALYKYSGRRELDFRKDLRIESADLAAGRLMGRIENGEPVELSVCREDGFILVCIL